jgi:dTDP-4-amino-4,6-dideoxygalactose transaminase
MILFETRASVILYNVLFSLKKSGFLKKNSVFLIPLNVCPIVPAVFLKAGVRFDFVDISLETLCIDETLLIRRVIEDKNIKGILFVKTYGTEYEPLETFKTIKNINKNIFLIDDCCLKIPDFDYDFNKSLSDLAIFSTGYSKYVDIGWGGFGFLRDEYLLCKENIPFNNNDLKKLTNSLSNSILKNKKFEYIDNDWLGSDVCLYDDFNKYTERVKYELLKINEHKKLINNIYSVGLDDDIQSNEMFWNWRFSIFVDNKKYLIEKIFNSDLFASSHYADIGLIYGYKEDTVSNANKVYFKVINLFNDFRFSEDDACKTVDLINKYLKG